MIRTLMTVAAALFISACGAESYTEAQMMALQSVADGALLVDVRSETEFNGGHMDGALNIPHTDIVEGLAKLGVDKSAPVVLYCRSGNRSGQAAASLEKAGYTDVTNAGGFNSLQGAAAKMAQTQG